MAVGGLGRRGGHKQAICCLASKPSKLLGRFRCDRAGLIALPRRDACGPCLCDLFHARSH